MSIIDDGGAAFPVVEVFNGTSVVRDSGLTLRDYFAAKAIQGMLSGPDALSRAANYRHVYAERAYQIADEMILAREGSS